MSIYTASDLTFTPSYELFNRVRFPLLCLLLTFAAPLALAQPAGNTTATQQGDRDIRSLEPGKPVERELAGGQSHAYKVAISAGQFLQISVEQRGVEVLVSLLGPDGKGLVELDTENKQGRKLASYVVGAGGDYQLTIQAKEKAAPAGRYEVRLVELRAATEQERALQEASNLSNEAGRLRGAGKSDEARALAERVVALREKHLGPEHPEVARALGNVALLYFEKGDYGQAEPLYQRALAIREKALGPEHPDVIRSLNGLASLYAEKGDYARSEPLYQRALAIKEKLYGPESPEVATTLESLSYLAYRQGDYTRAEALNRRVLAIREKTLGPDHPDIAGALSNVAVILYVKGDYAHAEPLYQRALAVAEKALGPEHPSVAEYLDNLALVYSEKGDYAQAAPLHRRALAIMEKANGAENVEVVRAVYNLALVYFRQGDYARAEPLFQRSLAAREKTLGPEHPDVARTLNALASLYHERGDDARATPLFQRALAIGEKALGPEHKDVALALYNLAAVYFDQGDLTRADAHYRRALAIYEKVFGPEHYDVAGTLDQLAGLTTAQGDLAQAVAMRSRAAAISERNVILNLAAGSERQKLTYLALLAEQTDKTVSLHVRNVPASAQARDLALTTLLQRKGRALDAMTDSLAALSRRASAQDRALLDQLKETNTRLARLVLNGPQQTSPAEHQQRIKDLESQKEKLEAEVSSRSAEFRVQAQPVTLAAVQAAIPADAALVEFAVYRPYNPNSARTGTQVAGDSHQRPTNPTFKTAKPASPKPASAFGAPRYVAYVLWQQGEARWVELGEQRAIDVAIDRLRQALRDKDRADVRQLARVVDEQVMRPVRVLLKDTRRAFLAPDGALNLLPFDALVDEHDHYLIKHFTFSYLTSGRDLLRLQVKQPSRQSAMVVADPDFGEEKGDGKTQERILKYNPGAKAADGIGAALAGAYFPPLAGTADEARALGAMLADATVLTRAQATEARLKQVHSPRLLHIATHGFFLADQPAAAGEGRLLRPSGRSEAEGVRVENPLLRSGLALAGANRRTAGDENDDGVLTALEAAGLDLWGTKLVVLSACDTGVGEVKAGEGVYGLRRALLLAGSETQVMSLWPVSDAATRDLMIGYYKRLLAGEGRTEALRQAQLELLNRKGQPSDTAKDGRKKDYSHPYYWASFIQSGEWANLDGKR